MRCGELNIVDKKRNMAGYEIGVSIKIVSIVAQESPADSIVRMVRVNAVVHQCVQNSNESITYFSSRFRAPAVAFSKFSRAVGKSWDIQIFPMNVILNSKLIEESFSNLICSLISDTSDKGMGKVKSMC